MTDAARKPMTRRKEDAWELAMDEMACLLNEDEERIEFREESSEDAGMPELGINLTGHEFTE